MGLSESKSAPLKCQDEASPLHSAARKGHYDTACRILSLGTEAIDSQDSVGRSPLFWATEYRQERLVELLLAHGANPAVRDKTRGFWKGGCDAQPGLAPCSPEKKGNLCLHWAAAVGCAPIARMLLEAGSDPNVPNYQGDSPLHVAAQERRYECLVLLLAHGAKVSLKNKAGQVPLHCARPSSPSWSALQAFSILPLHQEERVLSRDISRGFEQVPIPCLNGVDDEPCPRNFLYVTRNFLSDSVAVPEAALGRSQHCKCPQGCFLDCCPCVLCSKGPCYTKDGRLVPGICDSSGKMGTIFECGMLCSCASSCPNRVVQRGSRVQLQLFRTSAKGWGVRTVQDVPRGAFLCQYFGELISRAEAGRRQEDTYYYMVDTQAGQKYCLDGRFYGNVGRFLNHSCQPNVVAVQVAVVGQEVPGIAFFSTRPISAGEELGFDYGDNFWAVKGEGCSCLCGAPTCRYRAPRKAPTCPVGAGDLVPEPATGFQHRPLRGFALKSTRVNPLKATPRRPQGPLLDKRQKQEP